MKIQILHSRDPDSACEHEVFVDGKKVEWPDVKVEDIDPGAGYESEDYEERRREAQEKAEAPDATDYDKAIAESLQNARFERYELS